jgi:predicted Zn finger-like uncharacterized protein
MKFTCDSCSAQYMISDEKVGPSGVKVRCKKCGHVITVRRAEEVPAAAAPPTAAAPTPAGDGLDAELGNAFDSAFGDRPAAPDLDSTQAMAAEDAARIAAAPAPAPLATEWYVAIGEAQVGPLPIPDVKRKWEQGDIGPDSLVWRPGMGDWSPLSTVPELAAVLSPIPRPSPRASSAARGTTPAFGTSAPSTAAPDATWKPAGANALAALASEELQSRAAPPAAEPAKAGARPAGVRSLVEQMNLADQGGVEPTGAIPLSIKGVERTDENPIRRQSSVARGQEKIRHRRGTARVVLGVVVAVVLIVGGGVFGVVTYLDKRLPPGTLASVGVPGASEALPPPPAPLAPAPAPEGAAPPVAPAPAAQPTPTAPPPPPSVAATAPAPPAHAAVERPAARPARAAAAPPPTRVAAARPEEPAPAPPPRPAPKKKDALLDGIDSGGDDALADALGSGSSGRSVYVPPKPGGSAALAEQPSDGQITEAIKGKFDSLAACAEQNPASGGTLVIRWSITPEGGARDVKCKAPCATPALGTCLSAVVKNIRFPRTSNGRAGVEFPFNF